MKNRTSLVFVAVVALPAAFCSLVEAAPYGIVWTRQQREIRQILEISSPPIQSAPKKLVYYGGPVLAKVKVYAVFWGSDVDSITQRQIGGLLSATVNSSYMDWLKIYNTDIKAVDGRAGTNQKIGRGTYAGDVTIVPAHTSQNLDDLDIQAELEYQIDIGVLPKPDADTLFMLYFPPGVSIKIEDMASCMAFCAYHQGFTSGRHGNIFYGVMPDQGGACSIGCNFWETPFDGMSFLSTHELVEAVTDAFPTPGDKPAYPQAWNTTDGLEIGDVCGMQSVRLTTQEFTYTLQALFDNTISSCANGPYHSP